MRDHPSRRLFVTEGAEHFQIFSFSQTKSDGSLYVSSPTFSAIKWLTPARDAEGNPALAVSDSSGDGKLSIHGSGVTHVRSRDSRDSQLRVAGSVLKDSLNQTLGVRHLFSVLIAEPKHIPDSPALNRETDCVLRADRLLPYVIIFWAVPAVRRLTIEVSASFDVGDLETVPPESGWGVFPLVLHSVVWFAYRTKHLHRWPVHPHVCYHDGYLVPVLIGNGEGQCRLELRTPGYTLTETELRVTI